MKCTLTTRNAAADGDGVHWKKEDTYFVIIAMSVTVLDQLTKFFVSRLPLAISVPVLGNFLALTHRQNTGAAFSILENQNIFLISVTLLVLLAIVWYYPRVTKDQLPYAALIVGGAVGNLLDRLLRGYVIDFISFSFWPAFNIADMAITIGALVLAYKIVREK